MPLPIPGPGRPLGIKPEHVERAREASAKGLSLFGIAGRVGITERTCQRWALEGKQASEREESGENVSESEALKAAFWRAIHEGAVEAEEHFTASLTGTGSGGAQFWLERRLSNHYAKHRDKPEVVDRELAQAAAPAPLDPRAVLAELPASVLRELLAAKEAEEG